MKSLTSFFAVPKGEGDIRVVYDATRSGLNNAIWTPNFCLPTMDTVLANADENTYFGDIDLGEMFLNYFLDSSLQPYAGVDVSGFQINEESPTKSFMRWERSLMGVKSSPFNCVRVYLFGEDVIKGDHRAIGNPFRWDKVVDNLPGTVNYDPGRPWIYKYDTMTESMANFVVSYVDDLRTGSQQGKKECDHTTHTMAAGLNYLGKQDATRKRKMASKKPGPWAGAVMEAVEGEGLYVSTSLLKWNKMKGIIQHYREVIEQAAEKSQELKIWLDRKRLEQDTGFLVHMFMAYRNLRPYLKGFYLTLNGWRFDRDDGGWQLGKRYWKEVATDIWGDETRWEDVKERRRDGEESNPELVVMVPQMRKDVAFLSEMMANPSPTKRLVRGARIANIIYGFGDASGAGFGSSWLDGSQLKGGEDENATTRIDYRFGRWGSDGEGTSSNYRELRNLVETLEEIGQQGKLAGVEVFLFTDNSTAEAAFNRGSSSSVRLFELVKKVKLLEMHHQARVHVIHVAGTRMMKQGTDGLSRGCLVEGVMKGESI